MTDRLDIPYATFESVLAANPTWPLYHYVFETLDNNVANDVRAFTGHDEFIYHTKARDANATAYLNDYQSRTVQVINDDDAVAHLVGLTHPRPIFDSKGARVVANQAYQHADEATLFNGFRYVAPANAVTIFDEPVGNQLIYIQGGHADIHQGNDNNFIDFSIVDKDDALGMFGALGYTVGQDVLELGKFVDNYPVSPGTSKNVDLIARTATLVYPGLYRRIVVDNNHPTEDMILYILYMEYVQ